ncbi:hypothetical protein LRLP16767_LR202_02154 [Limosilactobacillus reuteri]|uniref:SLATT domain-containing protein n=2 Tax=Limosilactobacillus TaxID=2742598 RepID=A0A7W3TYY9_9LACO|nr:MULTISPECIES: SLATT domain-containing protein [Limosilactobacillus]MBB1085883.1 SLATT domain-containing protein [Limosilactobacillus fastidiosus]MCD7085780.1 SLATT domain-containing protein [Limosilactobacillus fastidiosus]MCD7113857.1 SLATT domain-containing protein [Limosilactobacillus fastidiosus]MCD7115689.1 SLATT domain-containing protein [Limosilactobacillus fastidiosus]CUR42494.1 hypothetical protein LRLP16767_LR202_02154 [Limosilactobacillus reuteri]
MNRIDIFNNTIDLLLSVKWTHKITAIHYDRLCKYDTVIKWCKICSSILSSGSIASLFAWNSLLSKIIAIIGSLTFTATELISNKFLLEKNKVSLFNSKEELWSISVELTSLARSINASSDEDNLMEFIDEYTEILNKVKNIQMGLPSASNKDIKKADKAINTDHDDNNWENKSSMLPPDLRKFNEEK